MFSADGIDVWAVGDDGITYRSLDGGVSFADGVLGSGRLNDVAARGLTVFVVGDFGKIWRSLDSGGAWDLTVPAGAPHLTGIALPSPSTGYVVGEGGLILKTGDGGATWTPQVSGTGARLDAVSFLDDLSGVAVGEAGTVLVTTDGGELWSPVTVPTAADLHAVDRRGNRVWVVGADGTALRSADGGVSFTAVPLGLVPGIDVRAVWLAGADSVYLAGGGGFIRLSADDGATWRFQVHRLHAPISDLCFAGGVGFAASSGTRIVLSTLDRGVVWRLPQGATVTRQWVQKLSRQLPARGSTFALHPTERRTIYCAIADTVYRSLDDGDTWAPLVRLPRTAKVNAFLVSPRDPDVFLAAVAGVDPDRIIRSTDHGQNWTTTLEENFGEYGIPLEADPDHPDTVYFGADQAGLFRSVDGGATWEEWGLEQFRSPCDIVAVPDRSNVVLVGDGVTNSGRAEYWKSTDHGRTWTLKSTRPSGASEIPGMAVSRPRNRMVFGTNWSAGGVQRSPDMGETWPSIAPGVNSNAWGVEVARDDPNVVVFGLYGGGNSYFSVDSGASFSTYYLSGSNYGFLLRDRALALALQSNGIHKMSFQHAYTPNRAQSLSLAAPNGGEVYAAGQPIDVLWDASGVALARIEYRRAPGDPWQAVAEVPGYHGTYAWTAPNDPTTSARIRVLDAWDGVPRDSSSAPFTIHAGAASVEGGGPAFGLWQNRPNPFAGRTEIGFALPEAGEVSLEVFDLQGQRVATLARGRRDAGTHRVPFGPGARDASGARLGPLSTGVYFYRLRAGERVSTRKMLLVR